MTATLAADLVPRAVRRSWRTAGYYADRDIYRLFADQVSAHPRRPAVIAETGTLTYSELHSQVTRLAAGLQAQGIGARDIVATQLPNGWYTCALDLAIAAIGAVALPIPAGRATAEVRSLLARSGAHAVVADAGAAAALRGVRGTLPTLRTVIGDAAELRGSAEFRCPSVDPDGPARILVSSGSEAEPKMVLYSHNALACGRGAFVGRLREPGEPLRAIFLPPLASAFGSSGSSVVLARHGGTLVLRSKFNADVALRAIAEDRPTHIFAVPTMLRMMLELPAAAEPGLSALRVIALGGAQLDTATAQRCRERFGCAVVNVYGSADGVNCHTAVDDPPGRQTTAGRPNPEVVDIKIVDDALQPVPAGTVGEVIARGPMTPMRYLGDESLNARYRTSGGWVRTGDLGTFSADGYLSIAGRRKDIVIRGGLNISPAEVEAALTAHPLVRDVACVGVPDDLMGERLCACAVTSAAVTVRQLSAFLDSAGLTRGKHPEKLLLLDALPLTPAGKVDKEALRHQARIDS